jgi:hypothetical protein
MNCSAISTKNKEFVVQLDNISPSVLRSPQLELARQKSSLNPLSLFNGNRVPRRGTW